MSAVPNNAIYISKASKSFQRGTKALNNVSATILSEVYSEYRGPWHQAWNVELENPATPPLRRAELRFARLCKYLQHRAPEAEAGYSILIFRLTQAELRTALEGPVTGW